MGVSSFSGSIGKACQKKVALFDESKMRYALRATLAGAFLTLTTAVGGIAADNSMQMNHDLGKFVFSFLFAWGLVFVLFLNTELATSNMMYLTAGVYYKAINLSKAVKILLFCTLFNLVGALFIGWLSSFSAPFLNLVDTSYLVTVVGVKLAKTNSQIIIEGILANIFVNIAILGFLFIKSSSARVSVIIIAVFMFVYLGYDHVIANFGSFSLVMYNNSHMINGFELFNVLRQWTMAFIGNYLGGGVCIGLCYAYLNNTKTIYQD